MSTIYSYQVGDVITVKYHMRGRRLTSGYRYKVIGVIPKYSFDDRVIVKNDLGQKVSASFSDCVLLGTGSSSGSSQKVESSDSEALPEGVNFRKGDRVVYLDGTKINYNGGYLTVRDCTKSALFTEELGSTAFDPDDFVQEDYWDMNNV